MSAKLPPPQRPPTDREAALIAALREFAHDPAPHSDEGWIDRIEGLRNITVDAEALWEQAIADSRTAGVSWRTLVRGLGLQVGTLHARLRDRPAQRIAAEPRVNRGLNPAEYASRQKRSLRGRRRLEATAATADA